MDFLEVIFPVSGVKTWVFIPPLVALVVSFFCSMGGVSGAFLLLPFQMSYLGFNTPAVSSTNLLYNIVAIPSGVYRYIKEGRMAWPLTMTIIVGTLPGVLVGYYLRVLFLPDPRAFKLFVGLVLLFIGSRLLWDLTGKAQSGKSRMKALEAKFEERRKLAREKHAANVAAGLPSEAVVKTTSFSLGKTEYEFWGERFSFNTTLLFFFALFVGVIGGTYGIGGGAIIAPFCVAIFRLPVYTVAGATLMATFLTSITGVFFYSLLPVSNGVKASPDWLLGLLFGAGGITGMYLGARFQKYVPQKIIKVMLGVLILFVAGKYIYQYIR
jgi:uncharacterized membrane protein YfcA